MGEQYIFETCTIVNKTHSKLEFQNITYALSNK